MIVLPHPMKWREYMLWVLTEHPELVCTREERAISLDRHLRSLAEIHHGRLETPEEVRIRIDGEQRQAGQAKGLFAPPRVPRFE